jgi:superfamily II DNA or RNA helicase
MNLRKHRREEYQITWLCKTCQDTDDEKMGRIVAWRPLVPKSYTEGQPITDFGDDSLEYLVKWEQKSYNHCVWVPGAWVYGVVAPAMRTAFLKRTFGEGVDESVDGERYNDSLLRWSEKDAIHDVWITPDIILDVQYAPRSREDEKKYRAKSHKDKFEDDLSRIFHVIKIYVKFEGLGYDDAVWDTPPSPDSGPLYDSYLDAYREYLNGKHFKPEPWRNMKERIDEFHGLDFRTEIEVKAQPKGLQRGKLMEYQLEGLNWMLYNFRDKRSVILADEMGLGKTVQVVALLSSLIQDSPKIWPFLIVVPNSTCANWRREIKKWAPDLRVVAYYGGRAPQSLALQYELFPDGSRDMKAHVVIMSYDSAKDTRGNFNSVKWAGLVVDEAQALKNDENSLYKALNALRIPFKLLLTGTPLQNNKRELFNLLQFIDPANMKAEDLDEHFGQITSENLPELHEKIRRYFLRRTKAMVLTFLPPMAQIIVPVSMSVLQEKLCKSIMERNPQLIRSVFVQRKMKVSERGSLSNILMQLRKCLCHPFIYSQAIEDRSAPPELMRRNLIEASSKLMLLAIMLPKLKERGHRVLLFSQFLDQLTILEDFVAGIGLKHERLDGNQSSMEKQKKIDAFNAPDSDIFIMLLSTRAGGVGINLATADTVIILDPDWNPHQDIQALSRAHRIGQRKKVLCFQLVTVDSVEEKILQIGRKKLALDHLLIESMDNEDEAPNDVESVLKHGAAALFGEGKKKDAITYDAAAVDKLLDRSMMEETKTDEDKSAESAFAHARVWANDEGALADDMQENDQNINLSVWDQILQQREEEARREAEKTMETLGRGGRRRGVSIMNYFPGCCSVTNPVQAANYTSHTGPRFEFDEGQDGAAAESDQGDGDGDFVGSDKSVAESSDVESMKSGAGESLTPGSSSRKAQGKAAQGTKTKKTPTKAGGARSVVGTPATPKASKQVTSRANSSRKGQQTPKKTTPKATPKSTPKQPRPRKPAATPATPKAAKKTAPKQAPQSQSSSRQPRTATPKKSSNTPTKAAPAGRAKTQARRRAGNKLPLAQLELEQDTPMADSPAPAEQDSPMAPPQTEQVKSPEQDQEQGSPEAPSRPSSPSRQA